MTDEELRRLIADSPTKSESIRRLFLAGIAKADIARFLELRYQHVYNVLLREGPRAQDAAGASSELAFTALQVDAKGRVQLPAEFLTENGLEKGGSVFCRNDSRGVTMMTRDSALEHLREVARKRMPDHAALLDALLGNAEGLRNIKAGKDTP